MIKHFKLIIGIIALLIAGAMYFTDFLITGDISHMYVQIVGALSFIPLNVFITVVILEQVLERQEKSGILKK